MARRATALQEYRAAAAGYPLFLIAGGHSFLSLDGHAPDARLTAALSRAYSRLAYDIGLLTPAEAAHLRALNIPLPTNWIVQSSRVETVLRTKGAITLGVVILPALAKETQVNPPEALRKEIAAAADHLHDKADLVVALSTWGVLAEQNLLETSPPRFDVFLGTGRGIGITGRLMNDDALLWMRSYDKGKALQRIDILGLPAKGQGGRVWRQGKNISWSTIPLGEKIYSDPGMLELFGSLDKSSK